MADFFCGPYNSFFDVAGAQILDLSHNFFCDCLPRQRPGSYGIESLLLNRQRRVSRGTDARVHGQLWHC
jgi:hypothetical protein